MAWEDNKIEKSPKPYKRNNWTNEEIIEILKGCKVNNPDNKELLMEWNFALGLAIDQFHDFNRPDTDHAACAMTPDGEIVVIGPVLPR